MTTETLTTSEQSPVLVTITLYREAFARHEQEIMALPADKLLNVNFDIPSATTTVMGAWPAIKSMRSEIATHLPTFDLGAFDRLEEYALAMAHTHLEHQASSTSPGELIALNERCVELRDIFFADVQALTRRGMLAPQEVAEFKGLVGYKNVAFELVGLVGVLRRHLPTILHRTAILPAELDEAEYKGQQLARAFGAREQGPAQQAESALRRQRAFTLFARTYELARRAILYLRADQEDGDLIIPSLYAGRVRKPRQNEANGSTEADETTAPSKPSEPSKPAPVVSPGSAIPEQVVPGGPGGHPFIQ